VSSSVKDAIRKAWHKVQELGESSNTFNFEGDVVKDVIRGLYRELVDNHISQYEEHDRTEAYDDLILYYGKDKLDAIIRSRIAERIDAPPKFIFCNDQTIWHIGPAENPQVIKSDNKGFKYLHYLLSRPGKSISAVELYQGFGGVSEDEDVVNKGGVNDPLLDITAEKNYLKRLTDIKKELEDATENLLAESKIEELKTEQEQLLFHLKKSAIKSGTTSDPNKEKIRNNIRSSINQALKKIREQSPETYPYLKQGIDMGHTLVYLPHSRLPSWELNKKLDN